MFKTPLDKLSKPCIILRATGYGLRATGYGLRATGYGLRATERTADGRPYGVFNCECESNLRRFDFIGYEQFFRRISFMEAR